MTMASQYKAKWSRRQIEIEDKPAEIPAASRDYKPLAQSCPLTNV